MEYGSTSEFNTAFKAIVNLYGFYDVEWLGIVQDADISAQAAFDRVCSGLRQANLAVPRRPWEVVGQNPRIATLILPGMDIAGDLETLVWETVADSERARCVREFLDCVENAGLPFPRPRSKAQMNAFLAAWHPPDRRLGEAMDARVFDFDHPAFARLIDLLPPEN